MCLYILVVSRWLLKPHTPCPATTPSQARGWGGGSPQQTAPELGHMPALNESGPLRVTQTTAQLEQNRAGEETAGAQAVGTPCAVPPPS